MTTRTHAIALVAALVLTVATFQQTITVPATAATPLMATQIA